MIVVNVSRPDLLNANQRLHWAVKNGRTSALRWQGKAAARFGLLANSGPFAGRVRCMVDVSYPTRHRHDVHNLMPTVKPIIDGFVDAGLLVDDSDDWLLGPDLRPTGSLCDKRFACSLNFTFEEA